ncbi:MAG: acetyl-CoA carboxylase biotin carboxyl carrier protein [Oscillospiraceae bacterium]|nr:acetyl-CoA carboxylase biotin carboxyl carrier protein [Oscillospiraceae bacterium]
MDIVKVTSELANIVRANSLSFIRVKEGVTEIEIGIPEPAVYGAVPTVPAAVIPTVAPAVAVASAPVQTASVGGNFVKSPIIGTFYAASSPDKPAFVKVGDKVEKGQVVCIVESMKLMNEITSEFSGTVGEICLKDGDAVEFDQKLIRID